MQKRVQLSLIANIRQLKLNKYKYSFNFRIIIGYKLYI